MHSKNFFFFYFLPHVHANLRRLLQKLEELEKEEELRETAGLYDSEPVSDGQIIMIDIHSVDIHSVDIHSVDIHSVVFSETLLYCDNGQSLTPK